jgi:hypothetical protein
MVELRAPSANRAAAVLNRPGRPAASRRVSGGSRLTKCDQRHTAFIVAAPAARGRHDWQSDDLNTLPGRRRGFTGPILAAVAIVGAFLIIHYYSL